jgi:hypothetical protein
MNHSTNGSPDNHGWALEMKWTTARVGIHVLVTELHVLCAVTHHCGMETIILDPIHKFSEFVHSFSPMLNSSTYVIPTHKSHHIAQLRLSDQRAILSLRRCRGDQEGGHDRQ